jgi:hypothetical protein
MDIVDKLKTRERAAIIPGDEVISARELMRWTPPDVLLEARLEIERLRAELSATQAERQRAQEACEQMGKRLREQDDQDHNDMSIDKAVSLGLLD